jgi:hypothetical protein
MCVVGASGPAVHQDEQRRGEWALSGVIVQALPSMSFCALNGHRAHGVVKSGVVVRDRRGGVFRGLAHTNKGVKEQN